MGVFGSGGELKAEEKIEAGEILGKMSGKRREEG